MTDLRRLTDGVLFQALLTGSLSFSHIHDLAAAHGQDGWKAWCYPLSVDLLTVAAYRKLNTARHDQASTGVAWCSFLLGLAASLAANVAGAWNTPDRPMAVALGLWPAVAFLFCTLLGHSAPAVVVASADVAPAPAPVAEHVVVDRVPSPAVPASVEAGSAVAALAPAGSATVSPSAAPSVDLSGISTDLLDYAVKLAADYRAKHGSPIPPLALRHRLGVSPLLAEAVHAHVTA